MGGKIFAIFILIVVAGVILYLVQSGALQKGYQSIQSLRPSGTSSASAPSYSYPTGTMSAPSYHSPAYTPPPSNAALPNFSPYDIPPGFTVNQLSYYFHQIRLSSVSSGGYGSYGQISLYAYPLNPSSSIDITGWQIKTNRSGISIPQIIDVYDPSGLPPLVDMRLREGDYANFYSTSAPFSLRLNKCIGYLAATMPAFNPPLPEMCPSIDRTQIQNLSGACQNFITQSASACRAPDTSSVSYPRNDYSCDDYVNSHFSYYSCFNEHRADPDFFSREIRVWLGSSPLDQFHDRVELLDSQGLLVDYYGY